MQPNSVLSKSMKVNTLQSGEYVIYRLIAADQNSVSMTDENGGPVKNNPARRLAKQTLVRDFDTNNMVMIGNVVAKNPIRKEDGSYRFEDVTKPVSFTDGIVRIEADQQATYEYMERHDGNADNPFRDKKKQPFYYRVNPKKRALITNNKNAMLADALSWVMNADAKEIKAINDCLPDGKKLNLESDFEIIKGDLFKIAMEDPIMVLKGSSNLEAIAKITVMESEYFNIIVWNEQDRVWVYGEDTEKQIAKIAIGNNRIAGLVEYFTSSTEGRSAYASIAKKLKKFLNIGNPNR